MGSKEKDKSDVKLSESFIKGVIALVFLIIGYQTALFMHNAAVLKIAAGRDGPDTVFVYKDNEIQEKENVRTVTQRRNSVHPPIVESVRRTLPVKQVKTFRFNPNTVTVEELCLLGFSLKQAESIDRYRKKGGRFSRKSDFAKSYVVSDSVYSRLEPFIDIPLVDLNAADSADLDALPGIGAWFVAKILEHRKALGGFSYKEQLMDIWNFGTDRYEGLCDLVEVDTLGVPPFRLWSLPADSLRRHPYIKNYETAHAIVLYRQSNPLSLWSLQGLRDAGVISQADYFRLERCHIERPPF